MNKFFHFFYSLWVYVRLSLVVVLLVPPLLVLLLIIPAQKCRTNKTIFKLLHLFYRATLWATMQDVLIIGAANITDEPAIIVANHESALDIPLVGVVMNGKPHIWYALAYFSHKPILGFFLGRLGIPLDREKAASAAFDFRRGIRQTASYTGHTLIFPEGARYTTGQVHEFLRGFAILARKVKRPVIPVFMPYNWIVYPPRSFLVHPHELVVVVGAPMVMEENESDGDFVHRVERWFTEQEKYRHLTIAQIRHNKEI